MPLMNLTRRGLKVLEYMIMSSEDLQNLVTRFRSLQVANEWVELKLNYDNPDEIGEYISALSNSAALWF